MYLKSFNNIKNIFEKKNIFILYILNLTIYASFLSNIFSCAVVDNHFIVIKLKVASAHSSLNMALISVYSIRLLVNIVVHCFTEEKRQSTYEGMRWGMTINRIENFSELT